MADTEEVPIPEEEDPTKKLYTYEKSLITPIPEEDDEDE